MSLQSASVLILVQGLTVMLCSRQERNSLHVTLGSSHGNSPTNIVTSTIPHDHTSTGPPRYDFFCTSGATYGSVPQHVSIMRSRPSCINIVASPKSDIFMSSTKYNLSATTLLMKRNMIKLLQSLPAAVSKIFSGLISRCTIPCE